MESKRMNGQKRILSSSRFSEGARLLRGALAVFVGFFLMLVFGTVVYLLAKIRLRSAGWVAARMWARIFLQLLGVDVRIRGTLPDNRQGYIVIGNHTSSLDLLVYMAFVPNMIAVGKSSLRKIPMFGAAFASLGNIFVARGGGAESSKAMIKAVLERPKEWSVLIFPEGGRSLDGALLPIKKGFIHLVLQTRRPILPICAVGGYELHPKGQLFPRSGVFELRVGPELSTADWGEETLEEHRQQTFLALGNLLAADV
jgi:lysophosphatidate acyltransferase